MTSLKPVVIVTGGSRGIGLETVKSLLDQNAVVVALSRSSPSELVRLADAHKDSLTTFQCDIANETEVTKIIATVHETHGRIDGLVLNAGVLEPLGRIADPSVSLDAWKNSFDINFFSLITAIRASIGALRASNGRIVFVSSGSAVGSTGAWGPYNAAKAAMNSLCRTLASEEPDITCVAVRPGMVDTDMQSVLRASDAMSASDLKKFVGAHEEGKLVKPEDSGHVMASLSLRADKSLHGLFVSWDSEQCAAYRK